MAISYTFNAIILEESNKKHGAHTTLHEKSQLTAIRTDHGEMLYGREKQNELIAQHSGEISPTRCNN